MPPRTGCSTCWAGRCGTPTRSATTCATTCVEHLGDHEAVLVVDETGDLKKGTTTVGVQRQYTGTAGRIENAQVAVYLVYATVPGTRLIDRELYLPRSWTDDPDRCQAAGVPDHVGFATKPELATPMIARALDAGSRRPGSPATRSTAATRSCGPRWRPAGSATSSRSPATTDVTAGGDTSAPTPWSRRSRRGPGSSCRPARAPRATASTTGPSSASTPAGDQAGQHRLLVRRNRSTGELAFYRCFTPRPVPLAALVRVAGRRWTIEEPFQTGKGLVGLDQHQVRRWRSWYRWATLAMLAHAFLVVAA